MSLISGLNEALIQLKSVVGQSNYIDDPKKMDAYLSDWRNNFQGSSPLILKPANTKMVSEILSICNLNSISVVPQGGNTGLVGGSVPSEKGNEVIISLEKMNKILDIDSINYTMTVEAGCILSNVQDAALNADRIFPLSLAAEGSCQVGGNLATNAGGTGVLRYGNAKELVLGLEVVLADGSIINNLKRLRKDNTGYDLKQLFMGSEGTLGVITKAVIKLFPIPRNKVTCILALPNIESTVAVLASLRVITGDNITAFEYIDRNCINLLIKKLELNDIFYKEYEHYALVELSSSRQNENLMLLLEDAISTSIKNESVSDAIVASNETQAVQFWNLRESLSGLLKNNGDFVTFDISVSISLLPELIEKAEKICNHICRNSKAYIFGHIGDGNIHYYLFKPTKMTNNEFRGLKEQIKTSIYDITTELNGSYSAEHGIGLAKKEELKKYSSQSEIDLMKLIKKSLDPNNIMNPGKVL
ncbi:MAG: FAD-binding oxidoreductase [Pseudomonadota bacterium]|nr:FAD-binding oxidoreductase [Pseudomonadota bacterium]